MSAPAWLAQRIEQWPISKLLPYARNARTHSDSQVAQIAASIAQFGFTNPVLAGSDGVIVAGHGRLAAAQRLGMETVPVVVLDHLTPTQRRALVIADNRIAENAGWDEDVLRLEFDDLTAAEFDLGLTGFDDDAVADILERGASPKGGMTPDDDVPEVATTTVTKTGDVWILGAHRVMCGDATRSADVGRLCDGRAVDMFLTDPPYNVDYTGKTGSRMTIANDSMASDQFRVFLGKAFSAANAAMKPGAVFYIWHADLEGYNFRGAALDIGWQVRQCLVWKKSSLVIGWQDYHSIHEPCLYGWKEGAAHLWASDRKQTTVLEFDRPSRSADHPTMKPVALFEYLLLNNTRNRDIVLDAFGGSGTTLIAAERSSRIARLIEVDPKYVDVIVRRWQAWTGQSAVRESDGVRFDDIAPTVAEA